MKAEIFVGMDVSQACVDVAMQPDTAFQIPHDEQGIAQFAQAVRPPVRPVPDEQTQALAALVARRQQLIEMLTAEKNRLRLAAQPIQKRL